MRGLPERRWYARAALLLASLGASYACGGLSGREIRGDSGGTSGTSGTSAGGDAAAPPPTDAGSDAGEPELVSVVAGGSHSCVLSRDGRVLCWGRNDYSQLGDGTTRDQATPVRVVGLGSASSIGAYDLFSCAAVEGGTVACWGGARDQRLGSIPANPDPPWGTQPVTVPGVIGALGLSRGSTARHACAITSPWMYCWGSNEYGQLSQRPTAPAASPAVAEGSSDTTMAGGAYAESCIVNVRGYVGCSGLAPGNGQHEESSILTTVLGVEDASAVATGEGFTCALFAKNAVGCWGENPYGGLGDGTTRDREDVVVVDGLGPATTAIALGALHACALDASGTVRCWGNNPYGQLGDGTYEQSSRPVTVVGLDDAVEVAAGNDHTCARRASGEVVCWGLNEYGQLGDGSHDDSPLPVTVLGLR